MCGSITPDQARPTVLATQNDYKIAIFCALPLEADAVLKTFTTQFRRPFPKAPSDSNAYSVGQIAGHHVVLVHMEGMGKSNAARAAANCRATFQSLKVALVVGICRGVPNPDASNEQVYLGDVIVSDGMVQYDYGRQYPHAFIRKTDVASMPSRHSSEIRSLLAKLRTKFHREACRQRTVAELHALLGDNVDSLYPGTNQDKVFAPAYLHKHHSDGGCAECYYGGVCEIALGMSCENLGCDDAHLSRKGQIGRLVMADNNAQMPFPDVKFGTIASGDKVMKSGEERDTVARETNIIAFEMEGAGVWDTFQGNCLVIKAVCDYADSHQSKKWQSYAALAAAAFTKIFLEEWS